MRPLCATNLLQEFGSKLDTSEFNYSLILRLSPSIQLNGSYDLYE